MLLNRLEALLMNNPVRAGVQRRFEARRLDHPREDCFDAVRLRDGIEQSGLSLVGWRVTWGLVAWFAARKPPLA